MAPFPFASSAYRLDDVVIPRQTAKVLEDLKIQKEKPRGPELPLGAFFTPYPGETDSENLLDRTRQYGC
jgi:hypothetical protein